MINVAIVEDDKKIRESLVTLIKRSKGFTCSASYADGETALNEIPKMVPDVILMDINLPGMNGIECVNQLKKVKPGLLIIMLTVYEDDVKIFNSLKAGAVGYLIKSASPNEILQAITDVYAGGSPMSLQIARKIVQSFHKIYEDEINISKLSEREKEILDLLAQGYFYKEIADKLYVSPETIHKHLRNVYEKLHVRSRTEAVLKYLQK